MYYLTVFILCPGSDGQLSDWYSEEKSGLKQVAFFQALKVSGNGGGGGGGRGCFELTCCPTCS